MHASNSDSIRTGLFTATIVAVASLLASGATAEVVSKFPATDVAGWTQTRPENTRLGIFESRLSQGWQFGYLEPSVQVSGWRQGFEDSPAVIDDLRNDASVRIDLALPSFPILSVSYGRQQRKLLASSWVGELSDVEVNTASAALWYGFGSWEISAQSASTENADLATGAPDWSTVEHSAMLTYHVLPSLSVAAGGGFMQQRYGSGSDWLSSRSVTASAYYMLPSYGINAFVWGSMIDNDDAYGELASRNYDIALRVAKELQRPWLPIAGKQSIGLEFAMSQYQDLVYTRYSSRASEARLVFRIEN